MATRAVITLPERIRRGDVVEVRALLGHPMETGYRVDAGGQVVPQDLVRRFSCELDGVPVFSAELYAAVAANPYVAFRLRAERSGTLRFQWQGDRGFAHTEVQAFKVD